MKYKDSMYNNIFKIGSEQYLYNAHSGLFCKIDKETLSYIKEIEMNKEAEQNRNFSFLLKKGVQISPHRCANFV